MRVRIYLIYATSDSHLLHDNIRYLCKRPFNSCYEMDRAIIANWNSVIQPEDEVYHLGDVGYKNPTLLVNLLRELNGTKYLLQGNHDHKLVKDSAFQNEWVWIDNYFELTYKGTLFCMSHFPLLAWNGSHRGSIMCHGHCHGNINNMNKDTRRIDVGVDSQNFFPISLDKILEKMQDVPTQQIFKQGSK